MVACEVAAALFNVPKKIARIDAQDYLSPLWGTLFNDKHIPVDLVISPDRAIARAILSLLKVPGASEAISLLGAAARLLAFRCDDKTPLIRTPLSHLNRVAPELDINIVSIVRNGHSFIPHAEDMLMAGDTVYFWLKVRKSNRPSVTSAWSAVPLNGLLFSAATRFPAIWERVWSRMTTSSAANN